MMIGVVMIMMLVTRTMTLMMDVHEVSVSVALMS